jgi:hypothetical protein
MNLVSVLESLAADTWERLRDAQELDVRFGEETVTDLVLLELKRKRHPGLLVLQTNKFVESTQGTDWELWFGSDSQGWLRLAVQAKRLNVSTGRYAALAHETGGQQQIDVLERFAKANGAVPLYCLFNFTEMADLATWHCCQTPVQSQLGCTLAPSSVIREALENRGHRTFQSIHTDRRTRPWRCLAKCSRFKSPKRESNSLLSAGDGIAELLGEDVKVYPRLPAAIQRARTEGGVISELTNFYGVDDRVAPSHVIILDFDSEEAV